MKRIEILKKIPNTSLNKGDVSGLLSDSVAESMIKKGYAKEYKQRAKRTVKSKEEKED